MMLHYCSTLILTTTGGRALISQHSSFSRPGRAHSTSAGACGNFVKAVELRERRIRCGSRWPGARTARTGSLSEKFHCDVMGSGSSFELSANGGEGMAPSLQLRGLLKFGFLWEKLVKLLLTLPLHRNFAVRNSFFLL